MKNIIKSMFYGEINEAERKLNVKLSKEWEKAFESF